MEYELQEFFVLVPVKVKFSVGGNFCATEMPRCCGSSSPPGKLIEECVIVIKDKIMGRVPLAVFESGHNVYQVNLQDLAALNVEVKDEKIYNKYCR